MKTIPVDTSKITALIGGAVGAATSDDGVQRHNAEGKPLFNVPRHCPCRRRQAFEISIDG